MARDGLLVFICAGVVLGLPPATSYRLPLLTLARGEDREGIDATLAVQKALWDGQQFSLRSNNKAAVEVLESQLAHVNGNQKYLTLLRDSYRGYIKDLNLKGKKAEAEVYQQRLNILEPGDAVKPTTRAANPPPAAKSDVAPPAATVKNVSPAQPHTVATTPVPPAKPMVSAAPTAPAPTPATSVIAASPASAPAAVAPANTVAASGAPKPIIRAMHQDDDNTFFMVGSGEQQKQARELLKRADQEFSSRRYREAGQLYEKVFHLDRQVAEAGRERLAYCKLDRVVDQLNNPPASGLPFAELEAEVRLAMTLAPRMDFAKQLLGDVEQRRGTQVAANGRTEAAAAPSVAVRHLGRDGAWSTSETANFRIYHNQPRELVEQVARIAERTRTEMQRKWFGNNGPEWNPKCLVVLYPTKQEYSRETHAPPESPGHSSFETEGSRVLSRRIDLHCDDPNLLIAVLPHETTHTVLVGNFGDKAVPRWADEGMAVLTEPRDKIDRHLRNLPVHGRNRELFGMQRLLEMNDYPEGRLIGAFYAESVSVVEFLVREKGPQVFTQFVRDGLRSGYEPALQRYYGYRDFNELEQRWNQFAFGNGGSSGLALGNP